MLIYDKGLDVDTCHILEMACIVTDGDLNILAEVNELQFRLRYRRQKLR